MIKTGHVTKLGVELKLGDVIKGRISAPLVIVYDEDSNSFKTCLIRVEEKMGMSGREYKTYIKTSYRGSLEEILECSELKVLYNIVTVKNSDYRESGTEIEEHYNKIIH